MGTMGTWLEWQILVEFLKRSCSLGTCNGSNSAEDKNLPVPDNTRQNGIRPLTKIGAYRK